MMKVFLLGTLTIYTSFTTFILHKSRDVPASQQYLSATSVLMGEVVKLIVSLALLYKSMYYDRPQIKLLSTEKEAAEIVERPTLMSVGARVLDKDALSVILPASLYVVQSMLQLIGMMYLSPLAYQTLSQFKIAAVASLSTLFLGKRLNSRHWIAILTLLIGVILVQRNGKSQTLPKIIKKDEFSQIKSIEIQALVGPILILISCIFGSSAGILLERKIKRDSRQGSLWIFNAQLSIVSIVPATCILASECYHKGVSNPFLNFSYLAWITVFSRAAGGILVALILKHVDNILKAFATCAAILLTLVISTIANGIYPPLEFCIGALMVIVSTIGYTFAEQLEKQKTQTFPEKS